MYIHLAKAELDWRVQTNYTGIFNAESKKKEDLILGEDEDSQFLKMAKQSLKRLESKETDKKVVKPSTEPTPKVFKSPTPKMPLQQMVWFFVCIVRVRG